MKNKPVLDRIREALHIISMQCYPDPKKWVAYYLQRQKKVRWGQKGQGKRGGIRIVYFIQLGNELIWLLTLYAKSNQENIPAHILKTLKEELVDGYE